MAITTTAAPAVSASAAGSSPKSTLSTWSGVATMTMSTSAPLAASLMDAAGFTPSAVSASARAGLMS